MQVFEILKDIENKYLVLPEFQRDFTWKDEDFKKFMISIYNKWPTGTLLIWKTKNPPKLRGDATPSDEVYTRIILDGQQRLTTLYFILKGKKPPYYMGNEPKNILKLYFNIETEEFRYYQKTIMANKREWVSITDFFVNNETAGKFIQSAKDEDRDYYVKHINKLNKLEFIKSYDYFVDNNKLAAISDLGEVVTIFNLVNKQGRTLQEEDLALAHISVYWPDLKDLFRSQIKLLASRGYTFNFNFLILCLNAIATGHAKFNHIYNVSKEDIEEAFFALQQSLLSLVNILNDRAFINSTSNYELKSDALLVPLVVYLSKNNYQFEISFRIMEI